MNSLSRMIYLADVVGNLNWWLAFACVGGLVVAMAWPIRNAWLNDFADGRGVTPAPIKALLTIAVCAATISIIVPSSSTIYAIAASEYGEDILKSPTADKAVKALDAWLDRQIAGETEK